MYKELFKILDNVDEWTYDPSYMVLYHVPTTLRIYVCHSWVSYYIHITGASSDDAPITWYPTILECLWTRWRINKLIRHKQQEGKKQLSQLLSE